MKNGDLVIYKGIEGVVYGKPRESKYKGIICLVKIGDDYIRVLQSELTLKSKFRITRIID
jgi:hypothetical protein